MMERIAMMERSKLSWVHLASIYAMNHRNVFWQDWCACWVLSRQDLVSCSWQKEVWVSAVGSEPGIMGYRRPSHHQRQGSDIYGRQVWRFRQAWENRFLLQTHETMQRREKARCVFIKRSLQLECCTKLTCENVGLGILVWAISMTLWSGDESG